MLISCIRIFTRNSWKNEKFIIGKDFYNSTKASQKLPSRSNHTTILQRLRLHNTATNQAFFHKAFPINSNSLKKCSLFKTLVHEFHLTSPRYINPIIWVVLRPLMKILAALSGRGFRKWWRSLPPGRKKYFLGVLKQNKIKFLGFTTLFSLLIIYYYVNHLEETPISRRKRFMAFEPKQMKFIGETEVKQVLSQYGNQILPYHDRNTRRVTNVVQQLIQRNKDLPEMRNKTFAIAVVDDPMENAFVLPNGEIFVFVGMLNVCSNNDQLGAVLAHEISHCILSHGAENFSFTHIVDFFMVILISFIWAILPSDILALITNWIAKQLLEISLHLPYNRKIETEADEVGLILAAKACLDVRESSAFWSKMSAIDTVKDIPQIEFLSTHPSHANRSSHLDTKIDEALKLRLDCGCPALKHQDPRKEVERLTKLLEAERRKYRHKQMVYVSP